MKRKNRNKKFYQKKSDSRTRCFPVFIFSLFPAWEIYIPADIGDANRNRIGRELRVMNVGEFLQGCIEGCYAWDLIL